MIKVLKSVVFLYSRHFMETWYLTILIAHVIQNHPSYSKVEKHSGFADLVTPKTIF
jgi:hypothetical protein